MTTETTTARQLIAESYALAGPNINSLEEETGNVKNANAIRWLNRLIDDSSYLKVAVPFQDVYETTIGPGLGLDGSSVDYFLPNMAHLEAAAFFLGEIRYEVRLSTSVRRFQTGTRVENVSSLPFTAYFRPSSGGGIITFYPIPASNYRANFWGRFNYSSITLNTVLDDIFQKFQIRYLSYLLAKEITFYYGYEWDLQKERALDLLEKRIKRKTAPDVEVRQYNLLGGDQGGNFWDALAFANANRS